MRIHEHARVDSLVDQPNVIDIIPMDDTENYQVVDLGDRAAVEAVGERYFYLADNADEIDLEGAFGLWADKIREIETGRRENPGTYAVSVCFDDNSRSLLGFVFKRKENR